MTGQVLDYWTFNIIRQNMYQRKFLQVIFCYRLHTWAAQLIRGVFHLNISICCFRVIWVLFYAFWSLHTTTSRWGRRQGVRRYHNCWSADTLGGLLNMSLRSVVSWTKLSSDKNQNFQSWDCFPCQIIRISGLPDE